MSFQLIAGGDNFITDPSATMALQVNVGNHSFFITNFNHRNGCPLYIYISMKIFLCLKFVLDGRGLFKIYIILVSSSDI
jgi:hypothetical protein